MVSTLSAEGVLSQAMKKVSYWTSRNARIEEWIKLETLYDENQEPGFESMVSNEPATVLSLAVHLLTGQPVKHRVQVGGQGDDAVLKAGKLERGLEGWWNLIDDLSFFSGKDFVIRELAYWIALSGWFSVQLGTRWDGEKLLPVFDIHDPRDSYPEYGTRSEGMLGYVHKWKATLGQARSIAAQAGLSFSTLSGDPAIVVDIYDIWDKVMDKVVHKTVVGLPQTGTAEWVRYEEVLDRPDIPMLVGPVGGSPWRRDGTSTGFEEWQKRMGLSVLEPNRKSWGAFNKYLSLFLEIAKNYSEPDRIIKRLEDDIGSRREDVRSGGNSYFTEDLNASITRDEPGRFPLEVARVLENIREQLDKGGFPPALYGAINLDLSGFAISQMLQAALHRLGPYKQALQRIMKYADIWFLNEFKREAPGSMVLSGKQHGRGIFLESFNPKTDIPTEFAIEVDVDLSLPSDMIERINIIRNAIPGNQPILDMMTALEDVLKVDDPYLVLNRINKDKLANNPAIDQLNAIRAIKAKARDLASTGEREMAQMFEDYANFLTSQTQEAMGQGASPSRRPGAIPPNVLPPEASGISPNAVRRARNPGAPNALRRFGGRP